MDFPKCQAGECSSGLTAFLLLLFLLAPATARAASAGADALVLVNSTSARYPDFQHRLQPYLDNFGVPYTVLDIASNSPDATLSRYAVILAGHGQLDTNGIYLNTNVQDALLAAVTNGTGLVNFDGELASDTGLPRYGFVQKIFGFGYGPAGSGSSAAFPATLPGAQMHFITARHRLGEVLPFRSALTLPGLTLPTNVAALVLSGSRPLVTITQCGQGRAVQWSSSDWLATSILGPLEGLDDVVWRSIVWAARKPFVMRALPPLVTMRVDDVSGPFWWVHSANTVGLKPWLGFYLNAVDESEAADLRSLVTNGLATASIHSTDSGSTAFYGNSSSTALSNNFYLGTQWHQSHGIPVSKVMVAHYNVISPNAFSGLHTWGVEFTMFYNSLGSPVGSPWLPLGPYRRYDPPQASNGNLPFFYADFLPIPSHPELDGQFFDCTTELRDDASCKEWCPAANDLSGSIARGTRQLKRALDSLVLPTLFTHEWYFLPSFTPANWLFLLQSITNNLAAYNPVYVTQDYACQYLRATRTSRLVSSAYDPVSSQITVSFTGKTDLETLVYTYFGEDNSISNFSASIPPFSQPQTFSLFLPSADSPVSVVLTAPSEGTTFSVPANIPLRASASTRLGNISRVAFFNGTNKLAEASAPPYSFIWSNVSPGNYVLTASAIDLLGDSAVSPPVRVLVTNPPVSLHISPATASVPPYGRQPFTAVALDALGTPLNWPSTVSWSCSGGGNIDASGWFTAGTSTGGPFTVRASFGDISGTSSVMVSGLPPSGPLLPSQTNRTVWSLGLLTVTNTSQANGSANCLATNTYRFAYPNRAALLADGWSFLATLPGGASRDTEITDPTTGTLVSYDQSAHPGLLRLPCDRGDLWASANNARNSLFRDLPPNWWSLRLAFSLSPTANYHQANLVLYQNDDNYLDVGLGFSSSEGGRRLTMDLELNGAPRTLGRVPFSETNLQLRLDKAPVSGAITGSYSLDGLNWSVLGMTNLVSGNPRLAIWTGGAPAAYAGSPNCDLQQLEIISSNAVPMELTYFLLTPPRGAAIDTNGIITWMPSLFQVPSTNVFTTVVTDNANPPLSATNSFTVVLRRFPPPPRIQSVVLSNRQPVITWESASDSIYRLQYKTDLLAPVWSDLPPDIVANGSSTTAADAPAPATERFYRILQVKP